MTLVETRRYGRHDVVRYIYGISIGDELPHIVSEAWLHSKVRSIYLSALPPLSTPTNRVDVVLWVYLVGLGEVKYLRAL
jgi:hypothetical protein